jgi:predicted small secreted protein
MLKARLLLAAVLVWASVLITGCNTASGFATGVAATTAGATAGAAEDVKGFWDGLVKVDDWIRNNLW